MSDVWKLKIQAFLHDPFDKPLVLFSEKHEIRAAEFRALLLGAPDIPEVVKNADHIASAMSRVIMPASGTRLDFVKNPLLINPLSGAEYDLGGLENFDEEGANVVVEQAKKVLEDSTASIKEEFKEDLRKVFFALWRQLPEELSTKNSSGKLGYLWHLLPADTRIPDHSIWDHTSLASAIASALPNPALLIFTLGPVQEFIASARRTQDLWAGSFLLSYLTWHAMKAIANSFGPDSIVFPNLYRQPLTDLWLYEEGVLKKQPGKSELQTPSFPNRFLAVLSGSNAPDLGNKAKEALTEEWENIWQTVKKEMESKLEIKDVSRWNELWKRQVGSFFEIYWVVYPWDQKPKEVLDSYKKFLGINNNFEFESFFQTLKSINESLINIGTVYQLLYDLTERSLGSRKSLRNFQQVAEEGWKCTLCGNREALHFEKDTTHGNLKKFWKKVSDSFPGHFLPEGKERLCAVCSVKRLAGEYYFKEKLGIDLKFPSTSTLAVDSFREKVIEKISEDEKLKRQVTDFVSSIEKAFIGDEISWTLNVSSTPRVAYLSEKCDTDVQKFTRFEGEWLFKESFNVEKIKREFGVTFPEDKLESLRKALNAIVKSVKTKLSRYYAVFYMDGDEMGKWLSGEKAPFIGEILHPLAKGELIKSNMESILKYRRPLSPALHNAICKALRDFSHESVRLVVEKRYAGKLVYAGGDDVLALVPLSNLLDVISELRWLYSGDEFESDSGLSVRSKNGYVKIGNNLYVAMGANATASVGAVIAHYTHPLSDVLKKARLAEKEAKDTYGRDAFVINLLKRSGDAMQAGYKWKYEKKDNTRVDTIKLLNETVTKLRDDVLSSRFAYAIYQEAEVLKSLDVECQKAEIKRLLKRHVNKEVVGEKRLQEMLDEFSIFLQNLNDMRGEMGFKDFAKFLLLARFFAKGSVA